MNRAKYEIEQQAVKDNFTFLMEFIEMNISATEMNNAILAEILTACEETLINIINYAYPSGPGPVKIAIEITNRSISITFIDGGIQFNPLEQPDADISLSLEEREIGGLGIHMVKKLMDEVNYEFKNGKNIFNIVKRLT